MSARKKDQVRSLVRNEYADNSLYRFIWLHYSNYETELKVLRLCPEELFLYVMHLVDDIKEKEEDYEEEIPALWDSIYNDLYEYAEGVSDDELSDAAVLIIVLLITVLCESEYLFHRNLAHTIGVKSMLRAKNPSRMYDFVYEEQLDKPLSEWIHGYMDSDEWLSDKIEERLSGKKKGGEKSATKRTSKGVKLTVETFKLTLEDEYTNKRLQNFYGGLVSAKYIDSSTLLKDFIELFSGRDSTCRIKWIKSKDVLYSLVKYLLDNHYITCSANKHWQIVESHFVDKYGYLLTNMHNATLTKIQQGVIEVLARTLDA